MTTELLSDRLERSTLEELPGLLGELRLAVCPHAPRKFLEDWLSFLAVNTPEALLAAAMMLKPERLTWDADSTAPECGTDWSLWEPDNSRRYTAIADIPAAALAAAIAKSMGL